jgi:hypothetical protein
VSWAGVLKAVLLLTGALATWLQQRGLLEAGKAESVAARLKEALSDLETAEAARRALRESLEREPGSLRDDDDGFRRSD